MFDKRRYLKIEKHDGTVEITKDTFEKQSSKTKRKGGIYYSYGSIPLLVSCDGHSDCYNFHCSMPGNYKKNLWFKAVIPATMPDNVIREKLQANKIISDTNAELYGNGIIGTQLLRIRSVLQNFSRNTERGISYNPIKDISTVLSHI